MTKLIIRGDIYFSKWSGSTIYRYYRDLSSNFMLPMCRHAKIESINNHRYSPMHHYKLHGEYHNIHTLDSDSDFAYKGVLIQSRNLEKLNEILS